MNIVTLIGNLATDVDLREVGPEKKVASFLLVVARAAAEELDPAGDHLERAPPLSVVLPGAGPQAPVDGDP